MRLGTLGFLSNLSPEKGLFEFLNLMAAIDSGGLPVRALLAGPFEDAGIREEAQARLRVTNIVEYLGPKYGDGKDAFFDDIDVFVFPTLYRNEAEPIVVHEAMSRGIPVIAYGRGCIPEMIGPESGLVIDPGESFAPQALAKIQEWVDSPESFRRASCGARARFASSRVGSSGLWCALLEEILGTADASRPHEPRQEEHAACQG